MKKWSMSVFHAMGSTCRIIAPDAGLAAHAESLVRSLEQRWSRFLPFSEVSELNATSGRLTVVSAETYTLLSTAQRARVATGGRFNPLMLEHLEGLGYDRSWDAGLGVVAGRPPVGVGTLQPIECYPETRAVRLPDGCRFDPGGIGKGLAGDMVADALVAAGAESVQVELGGDVRVAGPAWAGGPWAVRIDDSDHGVGDAGTITLPEGGVATSSTERRRWQFGDAMVHHLIDPTTGLPAITDLAAVTAVAPTLWWAEVVAKVVLMMGSVPGRTLMESLGATGVLVDRETGVHYQAVTPQEVVR